LLAGESVALVSDAGTPLVSDPGAALVAAAHAAGVRVEPVPGPSAVMAALSASGLGSDQFVFLGFPPPKRAARRKWLSDLAREARPLVLYEAPHRIRETLEDLLVTLGDRVVAIGRELTKVHEELVVRPISLHLENLTRGRGEYTVVIAPGNGTADVPETPTAGSIADEYGHLTDSCSHTRRSAIRALASKYGLSAREVYAMVEKGR
jgi:16S rRNA (cytidine1402-2'-O)-methyltransferase